MCGRIHLHLQRTCWEQAALLFALLLNIHLFLFHPRYPPDQQRLVFHFTAHLHALVPSVRNVLQQRHLPDMDSLSCGG